MGDKYICDICGYIYGPLIGDPENGIPPGVDFDEITVDWLCPLCNAEKEEFSLLSDSEIGICAEREKVPQVSEKRMHQVEIPQFNNKIILK